MQCIPRIQLQIIFVCIIPISEIRWEIQGEYILEAVIHPVLKCQKGMPEEVILVQHQFDVEQKDSDRANKV